MATEISHATDEPGRVEAVGQSARIVAILRDVATGGLAGLVAGTLIGGIGGRLVMRLAAVLVPEATGEFTENGERIGAITAQGSLGLLLFGGVGAGIAAAAIWVVIRSWLPERRRDRILASVPVALAFGSPLLIEGRNPDFVILGHHPVVVASLVALVAVTGPALVILDDWLDRRLPIPSSGGGPAIAAYAVITGVGLFLMVTLVIPIMRDVLGIPVFLALVGVGLATLLRWSERLRGRAGPASWLVNAARGLLALAVVLGLASVVVEVRGALGSG
jgi:hypothetical protein